MKKSIFYYLFAVVCTVCLFSACSDDDEKVVCPVEATTFTDANGLQLTYSGASMLGKKIVFTPDVTDGTKATLTLGGGDLDLTGLLNRSDNTSTISAPGVVPGEVTTTIPVESMIINGNKVTFEGTNEKDGRTIKYNGEVTSGSLKLELNVTMPTNALANTSWNLAPVGDISSDPISPIYLKWVADEFPFGDGTWDIQSALSMTLAFPVVGELTVPQMLSGVLNKVTFLPDGNIQASYKDGLTDAQWKTSELNIAMYSIVSDKLYLYLNPAQIMASASKERAGVDELLPNLMKLIVPMLTNGIPLSYATNAEGEMAAYLDTATLLPILKMVAPLFKDEVLVNGLVEMLKAQAGEMAGLVEMFMKPVLVAMPQIVSTTKSVQIGIKVVPAAK